MNEELKEKFNKLNEAVKEAIAENDVGVLKWHLDEMLIDAINKHNLKEVKNLLDAGANPNGRDEYGTPVLLYAVGTAKYLNGHTEIISELLKRGAKESINKEDEYGNTPFLTAVFNNDTEAVNLFLKYGANPYAVNGRGESPVSCARQTAKEYADMADTLERQPNADKDNAVDNNPEP